MDPREIDDRVFALYDEYCHGRIDRRAFLQGAASLTVAGGTGLAAARSLLPDYARAETIAPDDPRIAFRTIDYASPGGTSGTMRGVLAQPTGEGPFPVVLVLHENRGLNPYIEDVARRAAVEGFLALAPDGLSPVGGYPGNDDDGRALQKTLDPAKLRQDMLNGARYLKAHPLSTGRLGATGFCWGGGTTNFLAVAMGADLHAAVPFYGASAPASEVPRIEAPLLLHFAENDERINARWPAYRAALETHGKAFETHTYPGTRHGFHNDTTPRYDAAAAALAWERTATFFRKHLA